MVGWDGSMYCRDFRGHDSIVSVLGISREASEDCKDCCALLTVGL